ncbi:hypothetical protein AAMO2058_000057200 [Amorphochlora amoebiformis]
MLLAASLCSFLFIFVASEENKGKYESGISKGTRGGARPPKQSEFQKKLVEFWREKAKIRSEESFDELIKVIEKPGFREYVGRFYPPALRMDAAALLEKYVEELKVSEFVHNFPAIHPKTQIGHSVGFTDMSVEVGLNSTYFENLWELVALGYRNRSDNSITNGAEVGIMKFTNFTTFPPNFRESSQRPVYTAVNTLKIDMGNIDFGNLSAVFNREFSDNMTLMFMIDTGIIEFSCNKSLLRNFSFPVDCEYVLNHITDVGTPEYFNHLLLGNQRTWATQTLQDHMARTLASKWGEPRLSSTRIVTYLEADIAGALWYPEGIKFLLASFPAYFGSSAGHLIRKWCQQRGWALIWVLGADWNEKHHKPSLKYGFNGRIVDPLLKTTNVTCHPTDEAAFKITWELMEELRGKEGKGDTGEDISYQQGAEVWGQLADMVSADIQVEPLRANRCENIAAAIGLNLLGDCVASLNLF